MSLANIVKELRWLRFTLSRKIGVRLHRVRRLLAKPPVPRNEDGKIRIHLGCGDVDALGYINVDLKTAPHVHYIHSVTSLPFFEDDSADLVYACHVMEHFPADQLDQILWEWRRILKKGGILRVSVPDFDLLLKLYRESNNNVESIRQPLLGVPDGYYSHLLLFNFERMRAILVENGFENVRYWETSAVPDHGFEDWASRPLIYKGHPFPISLNVEADKK